MDGQDSQDFVLPLRVYLVHPDDPCLIDRSYSAVPRATCPDPSGACRCPSMATTRPDDLDRDGHGTLPGGSRLVPNRLPSLAQRANGVRNHFISR